MNEAQQLVLIKDFMVALAPEVARHRFTLIRHNYIPLVLGEEEHPSYTDTAIENARITLELAMHLAAQYGSCYDLLSEEDRPKTKKSSSETDQPAPPQPDPGPRSARLRGVGEDIPL
jgi:hypothetical protein